MPYDLSGLERRRFARIPCWGEVAYNYRPAQETEKSFNILVRGHRARLKNISITGIQFETEDPPAIHSHITLEIKLSEDTNPLSMNGKVVWTQSLEENDRHAVGVEFLASSHEDMRRAATFIGKYYE